MSTFLKAQTVAILVDHHIYECLYNQGISECLFNLFLVLNKVVRSVWLISFSDLNVTECNVVSIITCAIAT